METILATLITAIAILAAFLFGYCILGPIAYWIAEKLGLVQY